MKFDKDDTNIQLGILAIGLICMNIGFFANMFIRDTETLTFFNGLKDGICTGLMVVGTFLFVYSIFNLVRIRRKK